MGSPRRAPASGALGAPEAEVRRHVVGWVEARCSCEPPDVEIGESGTVVCPGCVVRVLAGDVAALRVALEQLVHAVDPMPRSKPGLEDWARGPVAAARAALRRVGARS